MARQNITKYILIFTVLCGPVLGHVRKFSQTDFNKWLDSDNFVVALFCSSISDGSCDSERQRLMTFSEDLAPYSDFVFGYIDKETDPILISEYNVQTLPAIKLFPYDAPAQLYSPTTPNSNLKARLLEIRNKYLSENKDVKASSTSTHKYKTKSFVKEIEGIKFESIVKNPDEHVMLMLYSAGCTELCDIFERVAKIFEEESEVGFYKLNLDNTGSLRKTFSFPRNPTIFWYPKHAKDGFIYGGSVGFKVLVEYVNDNAGLSRSYTGELKGTAGRIEEIDQIIHENINNILQKTNINKIITLIENQSKKLPHAKKYIDYYLGVLIEIRKGSDPGKVLRKEQDFLNQKISNRDTNKKESEEWRKYYNIITAFVDIAAQHHQRERTKTSSPKKIKTPERKLGDPYMAQLKEDLQWKHQSRHDEL